MTELGQESPFVTTSLVMVDGTTMPQAAVKNIKAPLHLILEAYCYRIRRFWLCRMHGTQVRGEKPRAARDESKSQA